jgi:hypothetical protein
VKALVLGWDDLLTDDWVDCVNALTILFRDEIPLPNQKSKREEALDVFA